MKHWASKYLEVSYKDMKCSEFVEHVLRDHFKKDVSFPTPEGYIFNQSQQIKKYVPQYCERTEHPETGDLVLMNGLRMMCHVGLYVEINRVGHVLHTEARLKTAALQNLKNLVYFGYTVEGFYKWR